jgi:hypothetical protein
MSDKHTLDRIRKTRNDKEEFERSRKENYKSPSGFVIMSRCMKDKNLDIINHFCDEHNLSETKREELIAKYNKLNYYTPIVSHYIHKESDQFPIPIQSE